MTSFPFGGPTGPTGDFAPDCTVAKVTGAGVGAGLGFWLFMLPSRVFAPPFDVVVLPEDVVVRGVGEGVPLGLCHTRSASGTSRMELVRKEAGQLRMQRAPSRVRTCCNPCDICGNLLSSPLG